VNGGALVLVPSEFELHRLWPDAVGAVGPVEVEHAGSAFRIAACGIGLALSGVLAARLLRSALPSRVALVGIAGSYRPDELPIGAAIAGTSVTCSGIGQGVLGDFRPLGKHQLPGAHLGAASLDVLPLTGIPGRPGGPILSVASASASPAEACFHLGRVPTAAVEEMEGYSVALACQDRGLPLSILRGVSNLAGDPDHRRWDVDAAIAACRALLADWLALTPEAGE
jgi:futalosine hydrolase